MTAAASPEDPARPAGHGLWRVYAAALGVGLVVASVRLVPELRLVFSVADAQGGLAVAWALIVAGLAFGVATGLALAALQTKGALRRVLAVLLALLCGYALWQSVTFVRIAGALADAADPTTAPERLLELDGYDTRYFGYEIDNRLAANPASPESLLRALAEKDQMGTRQCLRRNPNTPRDVLERLGDE